jgi:hypothetical protein
MADMAIARPIILTGLDGMRDEQPKRVGFWARDLNAFANGF